MYSKRLKDLRIENKLDQKDVAKEINMSRGSYGHYEIEDDIFNIYHLEKICNLFNVSIDYLFMFTDIKNYSNSKIADKKLSALRIKELRNEFKLTQIALAKSLNIANGTIANYEIGRNFIATPFLYELCKKYNISADYLLGKIDEPKYLK